MNIKYSNVLNISINFETSKSIPANNLEYETIDSLNPY